MTYPSIMKASRVVSPFSSGLPPKPTVKSHCSCSHTEQPFSTASNAVKFWLYKASQAETFFRL